MKSNSSFIGMTGRLPSDDGGLAHFRVVLDDRSRYRNDILSSGARGASEGRGNVVVKPRRRPLAITVLQGLLARY